MNNLKNKKKFVEIAIPGSTPIAFRYLFPLNTAIKVTKGSLVRINFRERKVFGFVLGIYEEFISMSLKPILEVLRSSWGVSPSDFKYYQWIIRYYHCAPGDPFKYFPILAQGEVKSPLQENIPAQALPELNSSQLTVFRSIENSLKNDKYLSFLLDGVTGSGKTIVYLYAVQEALKRGKSCLILVPEIAVAGHLIEQVKKYFPGQAEISHSRINPRLRKEIHLRCLVGKTRLLVGVRSAVFVPMDNLGLIVVDEEHDASFQQTSKTFRYNARDVAVMRGSFIGATVVLGSATPSMESRFNCDKNKYTALYLKKRYGDSVLPQVSIVDLTKEKEEGKWSLLSTTLLTSMEKHLNRGNQVILLMNRRGFAKYYLCRECGFLWKCPNCDITLTWHKERAKLLCHYCGHQIGEPAICTQCQGIKLKSKGIAIQNITEKIVQLFPDYGVLRFDADSTRRKGQMEDLLHTFKLGKASILIGTQMVTKGFDFEKVTLVGVILADTGLYFPDFRASERTFQMLTQVAGRAGRRKELGEVIIQTFSPEDSGVRHALSQDGLAFYKEELKDRKDHHYPPWRRLCVVKFEGKQLKNVERAGDQIRLVIDKWKIKNNWSDLEIKGPAPAGIYKMSSKYRFILLLKMAQTQPLNGLLDFLKKDSRTQALFRQGSGVRLFFEMDPLNLL